MKQIFTLFCLFLSLGLSAQITITNTTFPKIGDTLRFGTDNLPQNIEVGSPGGNKLWDFRRLQAPSNVEQILRPVSESSNASLYPNATWFYTGQGDTEFFYRKTNGSVLQIGFTGNTGLGGFDLRVVARNEPNIVEKTAPMRYEDTFNSTATQLIPTSAAFLPDTLFAGLPLRPDSLRLNSRIIQNSAIDAWGTMQIPIGTFDVLRERRVVTTTRRIEARTNALPLWIDVSTLFPVPGLAGTDTVVFYYFWSDRSVEPIAVVQTRGVEEQIVSVQFKSDQLLNTTYTPPSGRAYDIIAYPNPAIGSVRFDINGVPDGNYRLRIFNLLGQEVWSKRYHVTGGKRTVRLELGSFEKGTYLYSLSDDKGRTLLTKRLIVLLP